MSFWDNWAFGGVSPATEQARGDELDSALAKLNTQDYGPGGRIYNEIAQAQGPDVAIKDSQAVQDDLASSKTGDVQASIDANFWQGWQSGRDDVLAVPKFGTMAIFKTIPWYVWVVGGLVLLFYTGIGQGIVRKTFK